MGKIFTSITGPDLQACLAQAGDAMNAELRLDKVFIDAKEIQQLWLACDNWMVTVRREFISNPSWESLFRLCVSLKPEYIDLDSELAEKDFKKLLLIGKEAEIRLILSYHNYRLTPSFDQLKEKASILFSRKADVVKLACMVNDYDDNVTLLRLYAEFVPLITIGMGEKGKVSRLNALYFGERISYAASSQADAVAPGQMTYQEMRSLEKALKCD